MNEPKKPVTSTAVRAGRGDSGVLSSGASAAAGSETGFSATLQHAGLWDLVQLRCESRVRCVVCVSSGRQVGYLYFNEGQIVHAVTGGVQGERAALEILSWTSGSWDPCERAWPTIPTITATWQGLFLRAAQREDEARRDARPESRAARRSPPQALPPVPQAQRVPVRPPPPPAQPASPVRLASALLEPRAPSAQPPQPAPTPSRREESGVSYRPEDYAHSVRMNARGAIVTGHGSVEQHAEIAAYCCRLGDLLGELLGMGKVQAIDAALRGAGRCFVVREASGDTIVLRPRLDVDPAKIRAQLNLP